LQYENRSYSHGRSFGNKSEEEAKYKERIAEEERKAEVAKSRTEGAGDKEKF